MDLETTREPNTYRTEHDSMGPLQVPADALWGASTQRAVENFPISGEPLPGELIKALGLIKAAYARANRELGLLEPTVADAIRGAAQVIAEGAYHEQFPVDVFQTGSGTSSNMNANEVIAHLASGTAGRTVHPNDHVNAGQSSNDVFPGALQVAACLAIAEELRPALDHLATTIERRAAELDAVVKTGRTHLMDAMPVTLGQELTTWARQLRSADGRLADTLPRLATLPLGGTAVGTGVNAHPELGARVCALLADARGVPFRAMDHPFEGIGAQDNAVEASGQVKTVAVALMKIANDLRWMNSGPLAGLGEIA
ncbi:MAG: lyase family protein, partial [Thiohalospira sp.]